MVLKQDLVLIITLFKKKEERDRPPQKDLTNKAGISHPLSQQV